MLPREKPCQFEGKIWRYHFLQPSNQVSFFHNVFQFFIAYFYQILPIFFHFPFLGFPLPVFNFNYDGFFSRFYASSPLVAQTKNRALIIWYAAVLHCIVLCLCTSSASLPYEAVLGFKGRRLRVFSFHRVIVVWLGHSQVICPQPWPGQLPQLPRQFRSSSVLELTMQSIRVGCQQHTGKWCLGLMSESYFDFQQKIQAAHYTRLALLHSTSQFVACAQSL